METGEDVLAHELSTAGAQVNELGTDEENVGSQIASSSPCSPGKSTPKRERKVSFPDDSSLVRSVEPFDPWKDGEL